MLYSHSGARGGERPPAERARTTCLRLLPANGGVVMVDFIPGYVVPTPARVARPRRHRGRRGPRRDGDGRRLSRSGERCGTANANASAPNWTTRMRSRDAWPVGKPTTRCRAARSRTWPPTSSTSATWPGSLTSGSGPITTTPAVPRWSRDSSMWTGSRFSSPNSFVAVGPRTTSVRSPPGTSCRALREVERVAAELPADAARPRRPTCGGVGAR